MRVTPAYLESVASFYDLLHTEPAGSQRVLVCTNISCWMRGGDELLDAFCEAAGCDREKAGHGGSVSADGEVYVSGFECLGACDLAPMASINGRYFGPAGRRRRRHRARAASLRQRGATREGAGAAPSGRRAGRRAGPAGRRQAGAEPVSAGETRMLLRGAEDPEMATIDGYKRHGGYSAMEKAYRELEPDEIVNELEESGLRGRGGAGFSMGKKASFLPRGEMQKYLCCNADESEPGAFKDRELMQRNPHQLIEGIAIAALAAGVGHAFIFIRGEYDRQGDILDAAVAEAYEAGYLGTNVLGSRHDLELVVHRGAGAYICGEETALLDALEGKRGNPRLKPPFPAVEGLYGGPTLINNVETLSNVPHIVANGAEWFKSFGTEQSPGTKVVSISGCVQRPGNYEVELGIPTREIVYGLAGGPGDGREVKALLPRRLLLPGADRRRPRPALQLRGDGGGRLDARLGLDHRRRRPRLDSPDGAAHGALLPPRVVREMHALPRGDELDGEDAASGWPGATRPRWTSTSSPRSRRTSSATASASSATRWRCRSEPWSASSATSSRRRSPARRSLHTEEMMVRRRRSGRRTRSALMPIWCARAAADSRSRGGRL